MAPSSLLSATVSASEPVWSVLIVALVKSDRICTVERLELNEADCDCKVVRAAVKAVPAAVMSEVAAQEATEAETARPEAVSVTPETTADEVLEELKKRRLLLKDDIETLLTKAQ